MKKIAIGLAIAACLVVSAVNIAAAQGVQIPGQFAKVISKTVCFTNACTSYIRGAGNDIELYSAGNIQVQKQAFFNSGYTTHFDTVRIYPTYNSGTLLTCNSGTHGLLQATGGGSSSGVRTKLCLCTSDGAASPAYVWQNLASAALGTTTTCP